MSNRDLTVEELLRWSDWGGHWRVVELSSDDVVVDLCACTGEAMERARSADRALIDYLRSAPVDPASE